MFIMSEIINGLLTLPSELFAGPAVFLFIEDCVKAVLKSSRANELKLFQNVYYLKERMFFLKSDPTTLHIIFVRLEYLFENNIR